MLTRVGGGLRQHQNVLPSFACELWLPGLAAPEKGMRAAARVLGTRLAENRSLVRGLDGGNRLGTNSVMMIS